MSSTVYEKLWSAPHICCVCGSDLRDAEVGASVGVVQVLAQTPDADEVVALNDALRVSAQSYGDAVWTICQLFMRVRSARRIAMHHPNLNTFVSELQLQPVRSVEELPIELRHRLTLQVHKLFTQWPQNLVEFCAAAHLNAEHLSQDRSNCPPWFDEFIRQNLCIQKRGISRDQVLEVCGSIRASGKQITKTSVSRALGDSYSNVIDLLFAKRDKATQAETIQFLNWLFTWAEDTQSRRSGTEIRLRDSLILSLSMLVNAPVVEVASWSKSKCLARKDEASALLRVNGFTTEEYLIVIDEMIARYEQLRVTRSPIPDIEDAYFCGFRGTSVPLRSIQCTLKTAMKILDSRLARSVSVFSRQIWATEKDKTIKEVELPRL